MPAYKHDIIIDQGVTFQVEFSVTDPDTLLPFDFTGYTGVGQLLDHAKAKTADFVIILSSGKVLGELSEAVTAVLTPATTFTHTYYIDATHPTQPDYRISKGKALISGK